MEELLLQLMKYLQIRQDDLQHSHTLVFFSTVAIFMLAFMQVLQN